MIDEAIRSRALAVYRSGILIKLICADLGVSRTQLHHWINVTGIKRRQPHKTKNKRQLRPAA